MADGRFITHDKEGVMEGTRIITDARTGVQYLFVFSGYSGGLTLLVDQDGKPILDPNYVRAKL